MRPTLYPASQPAALAVQLDFLDTLDPPPARPDRPLTPRMLAALVAAASRPDGAILPVAGLNAAAAQALALALVRRGMARQEAGFSQGPSINAAGRAVAASEGGA